VIVLRRRFGARSGQLALAPFATPSGERVEDGLDVDGWFVLDITP
jgi:hypothetical protein